METSPSLWSQLLPLIPAAVIVLIFGYLTFRRLRGRPGSSPRKHKPLPAEPLPHFVFAKLTDPIGPMERGSKYEDPLDDALREHNHGFTTGGGTQTDRNGGISWIGLDIELRDLDAALLFTRDRLHELGAPPGSVLEYRVGEEQKTLPIA